MSPKLKVFMVLMIIAGAWGWAIYRAYALTPGSTGNNGHTDDFEGPRRPPMPQMSEEAQKAMRDRWQARRDRGETGPPTEEERAQMRAEFEKNTTPAQREAMQKAREQMRAEMEKQREHAKAMLGPDDLKSLENRRGRRGGFGGPGGGRGGPGGDGGGRRRGGGGPPQ